MSAIVTTLFVLIGPFAGQDMNINGHQFIGGKLEFRGSVEQTGYLTNLFSYYAAFPEAEATRLEEEAALERALGPIAPITPEGDGLPPAGDSKPPVIDETPKPTLAEAIGMLDPENDSHWTSNNLPGLDDLERLTGVNVTRADVNAIAEGFTRAKARAAKA